MTKEQVIRLVYNEFRVLKTFKNKIFMWENWLKLVMTIETPILVYMQMHLSKKKRSGSFFITYLKFCAGTGTWKEGE